MLMTGIDMTGTYDNLRVKKVEMRFNRNDAVEKGSTRLWCVICGVSPQISFDKLSSPNREKDGSTKSTARRRR
jgi:hypothetical protein